MLVPFANGDEDIALCVGSGRASAVPQRRFAFVRREVEDAGLQSGSVVSDQPAGVGANVAVRALTGIDDAVEQQQAGPALVLLRIEGDRPVAAVVAGSGRRGLDADRSSELLAARDQVSACRR